MSLKNDLIAVRSLIANPAHWTQGAYGLTADNTKITDRGDVNKYTLVKFCVLGACIHIATDLDAERRFALSGALFQQATILFSGAAIEDVNDKLGHAAVLQMIDAAIEMAPSA